MVGFQKQPEHKSLSITVWTCREGCIGMLPNGFHSPYVCRLKSIIFCIEFGSSWSDEKFWEKYLVDLRAFSMKRLQTIVGVNNYVWKCIKIWGISIWSMFHIIMLTPSLRRNILYCPWIFVYDFQSYFEHSLLYSENSISYWISQTLCDVILTISHVIQFIIGYTENSSVRPKFSGSSFRWAELTWHEDLSVHSNITQAMPLFLLLWSSVSTLLSLQVLH